MRVTRCVYVFVLCLFSLNSKKRLAFTFTSLSLIINIIKRTSFFYYNKCPLNVTVHTIPGTPLPTIRTRTHLQPKHKHSYTRSVHTHSVYSNGVLNMFMFKSSNVAGPWSSIVNISVNSCPCGCPWRLPADTGTAVWLPLEPGPGSDDWLGFCQPHIPVFGHLV